MNVYKVTNIDTLEEFTGSTDEVVERLHVTRDLLFLHAKKKTNYCGYVFEKIGICKVEKPDSTPKTTQTNIGLDNDLIQATKMGLSYGEWKSAKYNNFKI